MIAPPADTGNPFRGESQPGGVTPPSPPEEAWQVPPLPSRALGGQTPASVPSPRLLAEGFSAVLKTDSAPSTPPVTMPHAFTVPTERRQDEAQAGSNQDVDDLPGAGGLEIDLGADDDIDDAKEGRPVVEGATASADDWSLGPARLPTPRPAVAPRPILPPGKE